MSVSVATVEARVMGHVLAVVDRAAPGVPIDVETEPAAAVRGEALVLRCGGSYMKSAVHFQRVDADEPIPPLTGTDSPPERVRLTWHVRSADLVIDELHRGALPVPDFGLEPGTWAVEVLVWGRSAAVAYEDEIEEDDDGPVFPLGPEVWLLRFSPVS